MSSKFKILIKTFLLAIPCYLFVLVILTLPHGDAEISFETKAILHIISIILGINFARFLIKK